MASPNLGHLTKSSETMQPLPQTRFPDLARILERYAPAYHLDPAQPPPMSSGGFSGAAVWKIASRVGPLALRATPTANVDSLRLAELHRLLAHVCSSGFLQMPVPISTRYGESFFEECGAIWQLEPWMPGRADYWTSPSATRLSAAVTSLARWHLAAVRFVPQDTGQEWFFTAVASPAPGVARRLAVIEDWNAPQCEYVRAQLESSPWREFATFGGEILDRFIRLAPRVATRLNMGLQSLVPLQPCLRDIWHDHVLFTGDLVTGLIDPHAARSDSVATDLARLLGSLVGDDRQGWDAGLAAYQQIRPLSLDELALVELFDQGTVLLAGMTWLDWCCLQGRSFSERGKVVLRLRSILDRLRHLGMK
jgi:Ser/Thr protein kinase RdoA (MazF antagonist)